MGSRAIFIGDRFELNNGGYATVTSYDGCFDIGIITNTGFETITKSSQLIGGMVRDPLVRSVHGVGYLGIGEYLKRSKSYRSWNGIHTRCYCEATSIRQPAYINCIVADTWHNYQNFKPWHKDNYVDGWHLDKDLLVPENVIYSPDKCIYVPSQINTFFLTSKKKFSKLPFAVSENNLRFDNPLNTITFKTVKEACDGYWTLKLEKMRILVDEYPEFEEILVNYYDYFYEKHYMK